MEDWASGLTYNSDSNPKLAKATELGAVKAVDLDHSIYRQVKGLGGEGNIIVIDAPPHTNNPQYVNPITTLMRFHNFARVKALYYSEVETRLMDRTSLIFAEILYITKIFRRNKMLRPMMMRLELKIILK